MAMQNTLFLPEEIMLLVLRDKEGTVASGSMYPYAIGGAVLAELLLRERVRVPESKGKKIVELVGAGPVGDPLLDECLEKIRNANRRASLETWVSRFAGVRRLKHRIAERLCERGILRADEGKVLLVFTRKIYPEVNPEPEKRLIERLRQAIFTDTRDVDPRTVVLVSLAHNAGLLRMIFDKKKLKGRRARIEHIINGDLTGKATKKAIEAMQAAVMVACVMPAVVAASVRSR